jgi:hypothetical protein
VEDRSDIIVFVHPLNHGPIHLPFLHLSLSLQIDHGIDSISLDVLNILEAVWIRADIDSLFSELIHLKLVIEVAIAFVNEAIDDIALRCLNLLGGLEDRSEHTIIGRGVLNLNVPVWVPLDLNVVAIPSINAILIVKSESLVYLLLLLVLELYLALIWSHELSVLLLEPVISLDTPGHLDLVFPAP